VPAVRRALVAALALLLALAGQHATALAPPARPRVRVTLTGTYQRIAKDTFAGDRLLTTYDDVLVVHGHWHRLRLPRGTAPQPGSTVTVQADTVDPSSSVTRLDVTGFTPLASASPAPTSYTSVLVILAYWTAPDAVTQTRARDQILGDDDRWYREVTYGHVGLTGAVTPWLRIAAPTGGHCVDYGGDILLNAQAKAKGAGYDPARYDRTIVYFPRCTSSDATNVAGWATQPGNAVWLNGFMDRRTTVHEQGHNYGLGHAASLACVSGGTRVTLSASCTPSPYGDQYDAMGESRYAAHFTGYQKDAAGWLGDRKRVLATSSATFTLPPYEQPSSLPSVVVVSSPVKGRDYWLEYRRPIGYDAALPAGATGGVLVHLVDPLVGEGGYLLDGTPTDASAATAVVKAGTGWTAPDGVRISAGSATSTGLSVTVTGARPAPTVPGVPRGFTATPRDGSVDLGWAPPASDGGEPLTGWVVSVAGGPYDVSPLQLPALQTAATVPRLANGSAYTFTVRARNTLGAGPAATGTATPRAMPPSVRLTAPAPGATASRYLTVTADASPDPASDNLVTHVEFLVDGQQAAYSWNAPYQASLWTASWPNGAHTLTAVAGDDHGNRTVGDPVPFTIDNPYPVVSVTAPVAGDTIGTDSETLEAAVTLPASSGATVNHVEFYVSGPTYWYGSAYTAPYRVTWDTRLASGTYQVWARAYDSTGLWADSAPVTVTVTHPPPTVALTAPADGATLRGPSVRFAADATVTAPGASVARVEFVVDGYTPAGSDTTAPYEGSLDTSRYGAGWHTVTARVWETSGRSLASAARTFYVDNHPPAVTYTGPTRADPVPLTLTGTAKPGIGGAAVTRVVVRPPTGGDRTATLAPDGTWSLPWDGTGRYGNLTFYVTAYDADGLWAETGFTVYVVRPVPIVTGVAPAADAPVAAGSTVDIVVRVVPAPYQTTTVSSVCVYEPELYWLPHTCGTLGGDGAYHVPWVAQTPAARHTFMAQVRESDGTYDYQQVASVVVVLPPGVPAVGVTPGRDGTVTVSFTTPITQAVAPVTGYVVDVAGGETKYVAQGPVTFGGLVNGRQYTFSVAAVNLAGAGVPGYAVATPGTRTTVTSTASATTVTYGTTVTVTATVRDRDTGAPVGGRTVRLYACPSDRACATVALATTTSTGRATLTYTPRNRTDLVARFYLSGRFLAADSARTRVDVRHRVAAAFSASTVRADSTVRLTGTVAPAVSGLLVHLQRYYDGAWHTGTYALTNASGAVSIAVTKPRGTYRYRLLCDAAYGRITGVSAIRALTVT
jgi:hypothetical protein